MRLFSTRRRPTALAFSPAVLVAAIAAPALAAGLYFANASPAATSVTTLPTSVSADPLAPTRKSLAATTMPLGLISASLGTLTTGSAEIDDGAHRISDGLHTARSGSTDLADGMVALRQGVWALGDGSTKVSGGVNQVVDSLAGIGAVQGQVELIVAQVIDQLATSTDPAAKSAIDQLTTVKTTLSTAGLGTEVMARLRELQSGAAAVSFQLTDPKSEFVDGLARATTGSATLRDGLVTLDDGAAKLSVGTTSLVNGLKPVPGVVSTLRTNLTTASQALPPAAALSQAVAADQSPGTTTYFVRPAAPQWPFLVASLVLVGAAMVAWLRPGIARFPITATVAIAAAALLTMLGVARELSFAGYVATAAVLLLWSGAFVAGGRAMMAVARPAGRAVLTVAAGAQLVVCGAVGVGSWEWMSNVASFLPLGQAITAFNDIADAGPGVPTIVSAVVAVAIIAVASAVRTAHSTAHRPRTVSAETQDTTLVDSVP